MYEQVVLQLEAFRTLYSETMISDLKDFFVHGTRL